MRIAQQHVLGHSSHQMKCKTANIIAGSASNECLEMMIITCACPAC